MIGFHDKSIPKSWAKDYHEAIFEVSNNGRIDNELGRKGVSDCLVEQFRGLGRRLVLIDHLVSVGLIEFHLITGEVQVIPGACDSELIKDPGQTNAESMCLQFCNLLPKEFGFPYTAFMDNHITSIKLFQELCNIFVGACGSDMPVRNATIETPTPILLDPKR